MSLALRADSPIPTPFQWLPSNQWDGIDGNWSSFKINVGDKGDNTTIGQNFRILISTSATAAYIPTADTFCSRAQNYTSAGDCNDSRGIGIYKSSQSDGFDQEGSAAWQGLGSFDSGLSTKDVNYAADLTPNWGTDNIGLGDASSVSPMIAKLPTALLAANSSFWVGMFGLSKIPLKIGQNPYLGFLEEYYKTNLIPSFSYGYAAGQYYGNGEKGVFGSLTLGGYDASRIDPRNQVIISMPGGSASEDVTLKVGVQALQVTNGQGNPTDLISPSETFDADIDSTLPYLWLPGAACDALENEYGLSWDNDAQLYMLSDENISDNAGKKLTIRISNNQDSPVFANIDLPFEALNLQASPPLVTTPTRYFPLKRSPNGNFILGRAFLQETYLMVDYQRRNFTVAKAYIDDPMPSAVIVPIFTQEDAPQITNNGGGSKLSSGAIAGIVVACVVFALALAGVGFWFGRRRRQQQKTASKPEMIDVKDSHMDAVEAPYSPRSDTPSAGGKQRYTTDTYTSELADSRSTSQQGFYSTMNTHRYSESGSNHAELMGSPPLGTNEKADYFKFAPVEPMPLAELPGDYGASELPLRRPNARRNRSSGSGGSATGRPVADGERPEAIREEEDGAHSPILNRDETASPATTTEPEAYKDEPEDEILPAKPAGQTATATQKAEETRPEQSTTEATHKPSI